MVDPSIRGECSVILLSRFADIISGCIRVILSFLTLHAQVSMQNYLCPISLQLQHKHHKHSLILELIIYEGHAFHV